MNIFNMLRNVAFMVDPGPDENSALWKKLDYYQSVKRDSESTEEERAEVCTLEEVLKDNDVLPFLQHNHQPLIEFLSEKPHLEKILQYITSNLEETDVTCSQKSSKILCHNIPSVREAVFVDATENLNILFGFTGNETVSEKLKNLDAIHSGLLTQVIQKFLNTHNWYMVDYFSTKRAFEENSQQLLASPGLLLTLVDNTFCYSGSALAQWMENIKLVDKLVEAFSGKYGEQAICTAADVLGSVIQSISPLFQQLESDETISLLLNNSFSDENPYRATAEFQALSVFNLLSAKYSSEGCDHIPLPLVTIINAIPKFNQVISPSDDQNLTNTSGTIAFFGMKRMKVVELYRSLLNINSEPINVALIENDIFSFLIDAFFLYKWNNILQTTVMSMCQTIFRSENQELCKSLLESTDLINRISTSLLADLKAVQAGEPVSPHFGFLKEYKSKFQALIYSDTIRPLFEASSAWNEVLKFETSGATPTAAATEAENDSENAASADAPMTDSSIFNGKTFVVHLKEDSEARDIVELISANGGNVVESSDAATTPYSVVSDDNTHPAVQSAINSSVPVVTPDFIRQSVKNEGGDQPMEPSDAGEEVKEDEQLPENNDESVSNDVEMSGNESPGSSSMEETV